MPTAASVTLAVVCITATLISASCSFRSCSSPPELLVGDEFHGVLGEVVLRVSVEGYGRSVVAHRRSVKAPFQVDVQAGGRSAKCSATRAVEAALEQAYSVKVQGTVTQAELARVEATPIRDTLTLTIAIDMKDSDPFELRLLTSDKPPRPVEIRAYVPGRNIGFITESRVVALFDVDCPRPR